jgi:hypothetical protein
MKAFFYLLRWGRGMAWFLWFTHHDLFLERILFGISTALYNKEKFGAEGREERSDCRVGMWWCLCDYRYQYTIR